MRLRLAAAITFVLCSSAAAQDMTFYYPAPAAGVVSVATDVRVGPEGSGLTMDVYRRAGTTQPRPAFVIFSAGTAAQRRNPFVQGWARVAAANDLVAISADIRFDSTARDFRALMTHLRERGASLGIDTGAIAVYAASGNAWRALPLLQDPALTDVKAAVIYYGSAEVERFRGDLPVLWVRAGLDRPPLNAAISALAAKAVTQNAPVTLLNHPTGYHAFEIINDDDATRAIIDQTIAFVKQSTSRGYQAALRARLLEANAAGHVVAGNHREAATIYGRLVTDRPDDPRLGLSYGEALLGDAQFAAACEHFAKLKGKGLGPRDLGLPAARACAGKGDADGAIAWLQSIPKRFMPPDVAREPAFAVLRERAEFRAIFAP